MDPFIWNRLIRLLPLPPDNTPVADLRNIGPASVAMLAGIDVHSAGDVQRLGIPLIMRILNQRGLSVSMNLAYALQAGLNDQHWLELDPETKQELRNACQDAG